MMFSQGGSRGFSMILCGVALALCVVGLAESASAKEEKGMPSARKVAGDLFCTGEASYRIGNGPLLTGNAGHLPVSLPIQVNTKNSNCRLLLPGCGLFELGPQSTMRLDRALDGQMQMSMAQGSVAYSLPDGVRLKVVEPSGREAQAGQVKDSPSREYAHTGIARVIPNKFFEISNLAGKLSVAEKGGALIDVVLDNAYRFGSTADDAGAPVWRVSSAGGVTATGVRSLGAQTVAAPQMSAGVQNYIETCGRPASSPRDNKKHYDGDGDNSANNDGGDKDKDKEQGKDKDKDKDKDKK